MIYCPLSFPQYFTLRYFDWNLTLESFWFGEAGKNQIDSVLTVNEFNQQSEKVSKISRHNLQNYIKNQPVNLDDVVVVVVVFRLFTLLALRKPYRLNKWSHIASFFSFSFSNIHIPGESLDIRRTNSTLFFVSSPEPLSESKHRITA